MLIADSAAVVTPAALVKAPNLESEAVAARRQIVEQAVVLAAAPALAQRQPPGVLCPDFGVA